MSGDGSQRSLSGLLPGAGVLGIEGHSDVAVSGVTIYPEECGPGIALLSIPHPRRLAAGVTGDMDARTAWELGSRVIVAARPNPGGLPGSTWVRVANIERAVESVISSWYGHPANSLRVAAITGTKGKTTTAFLLRHILRARGLATGIVSTVEWGFGAERRPIKSAALPPGQLHGMLAAIRDAGCTDAVVEVVSAALATDRLRATRVRVGGFTNLQRDHLDIHETMENYAAAKHRLFEDCAETACFHVGDPTGRRFAAAYAGRKLTVSAGAVVADYQATVMRSDLGGSLAIVRGNGDEAALDLPIPGAHNVENALVAIGMALLLGTPFVAAVAALSSAESPPGRLHRVPGGKEVYVDYAHTPESLAQVLMFLRQHCARRLICVFGAGGDRDRGKRPQMGAAVATNADLSVVTTDNPRSESPESIIEDILAGMPSDKPRLVEIDRKIAITQAIREAKPGDIVLVAGRGHEKVQEWATHAEPFDDVEVVKSALADHDDAPATRLE